MEKKNKYEIEIIRLGIVVKDLRLNLKITQEHLSTLCEVDVRTIQRFENGKQNISISLLFSLAEALNVKPDILLSYVFKESI